MIFISDELVPFYRATTNNMSKNKHQDKLFI